MSPRTRPRPWTSTGLQSSSHWAGPSPRRRSTRRSATRCPTNRWLKPDSARSERRARNAHGTLRSGSQSLLAPGSGVQPEPDPVVQATLAALPELPGLRHQAVAAPMARTRLVQAEPRRGFRGIGEQHSPRADHLALRGCPGADPGVQRTGDEVGVGLLRRGLLDPAFDPDHPLELHPVELQRCLRVRRELVPLTALVVREEQQTPRVGALDEHDPGGRAAVSTAGAAAPGHEGAAAGSRPSAAVPPGADRPRGVDRTLDRDPRAGP